MIDLRDFCGLPLKFDEINHLLVFEEGVKEVMPAVRKLSEMLPLLKNKNVSSPLNEFYFMYRDIHLSADRDNLRKNKLRFDITVIPFAVIGDEYNKTAGHYHPQKEGSRLSYPEVYEVLQGKATYLLQRSTPPYQEIEEVVIIQAERRDKVIIPPNYGHITINAGGETLVMANWMADGIASVYQPYEEKQGGAYFAIRENDKIKFIPNYNYKNLSPPLIAPAKETNFFDKKPMYIQVIENIEKYRFLKEPDLIRNYRVG